ncbi:hypothetical protein RPPS3_03640 [Rhodopseudomonas palustris]|uniref:hypothetical protein n=1 Tax=Rhodopseudomonas palustris TaxID=1076 RepID=UPI000D19EBAE|nr:hypothetical protein [Rhodopseudomonas palustris]AVT74427.1 hypothetical protein RPPS3_03640 [Rhodopseudomonas palustris]
MAKAKTPTRRFTTNKTDVSENSIRRELDWAGDRSVVEKGSATDKKNYAESLSRALSQRFADALRKSFDGILPNPDGLGQESKARTGKGLKKLDVNYSTVELGLGLGVSIKTINFRDAKTKRYTKNYTRVDNELRAEAADYHERQPYSVLCAVVFVPLDACDDGGSAPSSFGQAIQTFRYRAGREKPVDDTTLFERILVGPYDAEPASFGVTGFFDVMDAPPRTGRPSSLMTFEQAISTIVEAYDARNKSVFKWAEGDTEILATPERQEDDEEI